MHDIEVTAGATEPVRARDSVIVGAGVASGWVLCDMLVFLQCGRPQLALDLLPGSIVAVALGAGIGWAFGRWRRLPLALLAVFALWSIAPWFLDQRPSTVRVWFPRALFVSCLAIAAAPLCLGRRGFGPLRVGLACGVLVCTALTARWQGYVPPPFWPLLWAALGTLGLGLLRRASIRRLGTVLAAAIPIYWVTVEARADLRMFERPDLAPSAVADAQGPSLVLIVLDTVRADRLATYGYERVTTPGLDAFARDDATRYANARSTSSWTLPSHASLFTGRFPGEHGAVQAGPNSQALPDDASTLAERTYTAGYQTAAIVANYMYLKPENGMDRGFEHFDHHPGGWVSGYQALVQLAGGVGRAGHLVYRDAEVITDQAIDWLDTVRAGPFFLMLNYLDAHEPYLPPAPFNRAFADERPVDRLTPTREISPLIYDRELLHLDFHVSRLFEALKERGVYDGTMVVVTSDHGEAFGEHGRWTHSRTLYEELVHVPLFVKPAGGRTTAVVHDPINGVDVHDLMLRGLGLAPEPRPAGFGLFAEFYERRRPQPGAERYIDLVAWMQDGLKLIASTEGRVQAYDLELDPDELRPVSLGTERVEAALQRARGWWDAHPIRAVSAQTTDEDTVSRLRALGYIGDD